MNTYETILNRRSIRCFKQTILSYQVLEKLVNAARYAPSAANLQPCEFIIIDDKEIVDNIFPTLKWAAYIAPEGNPPEGKRPIAYIVVLINKDKRPEGGIEDAASAVENILLTACKEGLGSCWLGSIDRDKIREILEIPHRCSVEFVVALGYPDENPVTEEMKDSLKYYKDEGGTLHVPKRSLESILHRNKYKVSQREGIKWR